MAADLYVSLSRVWYEALRNYNSGLTKHPVSGETTGAHIWTTGLQSLATTGQHERRGDRARLRALRRDAGDRKGTGLGLSTVFAVVRQPGGGGRIPTAMVSRFVTSSRATSGCGTAASSRSTWSAEASSPAVGTPNSPHGRIALKANQRVCRSVDIT
jgi:hypothetical protein